MTEDPNIIKVMMVEPEPSRAFKVATFVGCLAFLLYILMGWERQPRG